MPSAVGPCWSWARRARPAAPCRRRSSPAGSRCGPPCDRAASRPPLPAARPVAVDLVTGDGLEPALEGVRAAYHLAPNMHPDEVGHRRAGGRGRGRRRGGQRLVFHSVLHPDDARMPHHLRKAEAEGVLREALGERLTVLRPAAYHQNLARRRPGPGCCRCPTPSTPRSPTSTSPTSPRWRPTPCSEPTPGATLDLAGPEVLTTRQMTEEAATALGRPVSDTANHAGGVAGRPRRRSWASRPATTSPPCSRPTTRAGWSVTPTVLPAAARAGSDDLDDLSVTVAIVPDRR